MESIRRVNFSAFRILLPNTLSRMGAQNERGTQMKTAAQKYSESNAEAILACHNTRRVMLSQQHEYSLHIRPVPNAACPQCIADKLIAGAEKDSEKDGSVRCPQCKGYDEYCMFCEGTGMVTACQSREWLVQNPATERSL